MKISYFLAPILIRCKYPKAHVNYAGLHCAGPVSGLLEHLRNKGPEEALQGICAGVSSMVAGNNVAVASAAASRLISASGTHELDLSSKNLLEVSPDTDLIRPT